MAGIGAAHLLDPGEALVRIEDLVVEFPTRRGKVHAVSGISFDIRAGETLGLVGESGCGKSTTARALLQLPRPTSGTVEFDGTDLTQIGDKAMRRLRPDLQMIFQDPRSSLNARHTVRDIVSAGPRIWGWDHADIAERVDAVLDAVGLDPEAVADRRPTTFSGGQCQRISIARALIMEPKLVICDEPVSALDVSVQAQILNVLADMKQQFGITLLFISHDLGVVKNVSDRVIVMYLGRICEVATPDVLFDRAAHPYTRLLVDSVPRVSTDGRQAREPVPAGDLPSPIDPPGGCRFRTRCPRATEVCEAFVPEIRQVDEDHFVACHFPVIPVAVEPEVAASKEGPRHD
jgi:peptide/nickel transport system ATP-binding protein